MTTCKARNNRPQYTKAFYMQEMRNRKVKPMEGCGVRDRNWDRLANQSLLSLTSEKS